MLAPEVVAWLRKNGWEFGGDSSAEWTRQLPDGEIERPRFSDAGEGGFEATALKRYNSVFTPVNGKLPWGNQGLSWDDQGSFYGNGARELFGGDSRLQPVTLNGQQYVRVGEDISDPSFWTRTGDRGRKVLNEILNKVPKDKLSLYDPEQGWLMPASLMPALRKAAEADNLAGEGLLDNAAILSSIAFAPAMAGVAGAAAAGGAAASSPFTFQNLALQAAKGAFMSGAGGGNPLTGAVTGAVSSGVGGLVPSLTGISQIDNALKAALGGGLTSAIKGGNPLQGALGAAASSGLNSAVGSFFPTTASAVAGHSSSIPPVISDPFEVSDSPGQVVNPSPMDTNMDLDDWFANFDMSSLTEPVNFGGDQFWDNFDLSSLTDPVNFSGGTGNVFFNGFESGGSGLGGLAGLAKLLQGSGGASGGGLGSLLGGGGGLSDALTLGARIAPGLGALAFAQNQGSVDTSPLSNLLNSAPGATTTDTSPFQNISNSASSLGRAFDTSGLSQVMGESNSLGRAFNTADFTGLSNQVRNLTDPYSSSVLKDFDTRRGQQRGELLSSLNQRGVMGSSFGNMDIGNFDATGEVQRGKLAGELGLQGISAQRGLAQDVLGASQAQRGFEQAGLGLRGTLANQLLSAQDRARAFEQAGLGTQLAAQSGIQGAQNADRTFGLNVLNSKGNIASQLLNAQLQQKAIQSALFGRAFDVLGRAVAPSTSLFGG